MSKGGFAIAERNVGKVPLRMIVVEFLHLPADAVFHSPILDFKYTLASADALFADADARAYDMLIFRGGTTAPHTHHHDALMIARTAIALRETLEDGKVASVRMLPGEVRWISRGLTHSTENVATIPANYVLIEFPHAPK